jgi:hypothetical protein
VVSSSTQLSHKKLLGQSTREDKLDVATFLATIATFLLYQELIGRAVHGKFLGKDTFIPTQIYAYIKFKMVCVFLCCQRRE